jgi:hypothetical protein
MALKLLSTASLASWVRKQHGELYVKMEVGLGDLSTAVCFISVKGIYQIIVKICVR